MTKKERLQQQQLLIKALEVRDYIELDSAIEALEDGYFLSTVSEDLSQYAVDDLHHTFSELKDLGITYLSLKEYNSFAEDYQ